MTPAISPPEEASRLLSLYGGGDRLGECLEVLRDQFNVIQVRFQFVLTLATLALTITGFSGPRIAQTNAFARYSMAFGIFLVLVSVVILLAGGLRIRWITQFKDTDPHAILVGIIQYRNSKTTLYYWVLTTLVVGLTCYVASVITYLLYGT
jgi:ABC-type uncharacterized transport system permease subunit